MAEQGSERVGAAIATARRRVQIMSPESSIAVDSLGMQISGKLERMLERSHLERGILNDGGHGIRSNERNSLSTREDSEPEERQRVTFVVRRRGCSGQRPLD